MADEETEKILEEIRKLKEEIEPFKKYRLSNFCDPAWDMGAIQDLSTFYGLNILKVRDKVKELEQKLENIHTKAIITDADKQVIWVEDFMERIEKLESDKEAYYNDDRKDFIKNIDFCKERIENLEKHDIFRIWASVRKGGKTTLDAILGDNARIKELGKQLSELKSVLKAYFKYIIGTTMSKNFQIFIEGLLKKLSEGETDSTPSDATFTTPEGLKINAILHIEKLTTEKLIREFLDKLENCPIGEANIEDYLNLLIEEYKAMLDEKE